MDKEVNDLFDQGAEGARQAFENYVDSRMSHWKLERYLLKPGGPALWLADQLLGLPDEVNAFYKEGRRLYLKRMDKVIDQVAAAVETGLNEAKKTISDGRAEIKDYVEKLPENLRKVGEQAATNIQDKFDTLRQSVDDKGNQLVDQLAHKYVENLQKIDERIDQMKAENRGLVDKAKEQIQGVIDTIVNLKNMLLGVLARAAAAINKIIQDPIGFLGNLVSGVKAGLSKFMSNLGTHLQKGLMEWLFGALAGAGIQIPQRFDLKGIISLVLQVLGLTYANFRARAVAIVGEPAVRTLETTAEVFITLMREGVASLWRFIKDKVGDIKSMIMDSILAFVRDRVIIAGITWIIGLLNPASAFVKACKAIYDIIMFFVSRGSQIMALVNAIIDSITAIAKGAIGAMATAVEGALARSIPVAIGFLASLLGLGDISGTIRRTIQKIQAPVNKAIDWVINLAVKGVKAVRKFIAQAGVPQDPNERLRLGMQAAGRAATTLSTTQLDRPLINSALAAIKIRYGFQVLEGFKRNDKWWIRGTINPSDEQPIQEATDEELQLLDDGLLSVAERRTLLNNARGIVKNETVIATLLNGVRNQNTRKDRAVLVLNRLVSKNLTDGYRLDTKETIRPGVGKSFEMDYYGAYLSNNSIQVNYVRRDGHGGSARSPVGFSYIVAVPSGAGGTNPVKAISFDFLVHPTIESAGIRGVGSKMFQLATAHFQTQYQAVKADWYRLQFYQRGGRPDMSLNLVKYLQGRRSDLSPEESAKLTWTYNRVRELYAPAEIELTVTEDIRDINNVRDGEGVHVLMRPK